MVKRWSESGKTKKNMTKLLIREEKPGVGDPK